MTTGVVQKRHTFFSFHYQYDVWRANQIRQSWRFRKETMREAHGFFDKSLWEAAKSDNAESLKSTIIKQMEGTSVTCVLSGRETSNRRWVRYEIARSIVRNNGIFCVSLKGMKRQDNVISAGGINPLSVMGVYRLDDGAIKLAEKKNGKWVFYQDYTRSITLPRNWTPPRNKSVVPLSNYTFQKHWVSDAGSVNFGTWVRDAAMNAGR